MKPAPTVRAFEHHTGFLTAEELAALRALVAAKADRFIPVNGKAGLGPRYRVLDGEQIAAHAPAIVDLGQRRVRPVVERFAGRSLAFLDSSRRALRVQTYSQRGDGFRWHFDGHPFVALLTLENHNRGATEFLSVRLSRWLRPAFYALYPLPQVFSLFPRQTVEARPGDLLVMRGRKALHRGVTRGDGKERTVVAYTFADPEHRPNPLHDWIARRLNY